MKKVLAILLTALMALSLTPAALAYDLVLDNDGDLGSDGQMLPGVVYEFMLDEARDEPSVALTSTNFSLSVDWYEGRSYVEYVRITDGRIAIKLKPTGVYTDEKNIEAEITLTAKRDITRRLGDDDDRTILIEKGDTFSISLSETIARDVVEVEGEEEPGDVSPYMADDADTIFVCTSAGYVGFSAGDRDFMLVTRMGNNKKAYIDVDTAIIEKIENQYKGNGYNLSYYKFNDGPNVSNGTMSIRQTAYVYSWDGSKLTPISTTEKDGRCQWKVEGKVGTYVISDKELVAGAQTGGTQESSSSSASSAPQGGGSAPASGVNKNPDTGR